MSPFLVLIFIVPGLIILFLGRYIGKTGYIEVLKSYNEKKKYNREGLTIYIKKLMMSTGLVTIVSSIITFIAALISKNEMIIGVFLLVYSGITIQYIIRLRRSCKKFEV